MPGWSSRPSIRRIGFSPRFGRPLYVLRAFAVWRVLRLRRRTGMRRVGLALFFVQLAPVWSWMFFAAQSPALGVINIIPQLTAIIATLVVFLRLDVAAALALIPLATWVTFAAG